MGTKCGPLLLREVVVILPGARRARRADASRRGRSPPLGVGRNRPRRSERQTRVCLRRTRRPAGGRRRGDRNQPSGGLDVAGKHPAAHHAGIRMAQGSDLRQAEVQWSANCRRSSPARSHRSLWEAPPTARPPTNLVRTPAEVLTPRRVAAIETSPCADGPQANTSNGFPDRSTLVVVSGQGARLSAACQAVILHQRMANGLSMASTPEGPALTSVLCTRSHPGGCSFPA